MNVLTQFETASTVKAVPEDEHRPNCQKCNLGMWLMGHEPRVLSTKTVEHRTYVCEVCGELEGVTV